MADILTMRRLLGFKDFYPNEKPRSKIYYASKVGREMVEKTTPFFLSYLKFGGFPELDLLFREWFTFNDFKFFQSPYYLHIETEYKRIKNFYPNEKHSILSVESLLNLFLWVTNQKDLPELVKKPDASVTLPFLELILLFNDDILNNYEKATQSIKKFGENRKLQRLILACSFSQSDLINVDYAQLFYTQIYKKAKLLTFLEDSQKYRILLDKVLDEFDCYDKGEFLKALGSAVAGGVGAKQPTWTVLTTINSSKNDAAKGMLILNKLTLDDKELNIVDQDDYLNLRNKPFKRITDGEYRVVFELFLIKKLYNGLIFKLSSYDKNFLGNIRTDFSEEVLVYDVLDSIFESEQIVKIKGKKFKEYKLEREPDYYVREADRILLFESKDFFMSGTEKLSYDFSIIEGGLMKEGRLKKAVVQLVHNIGRCLKKEIPTDKSYDASKILIFPIVLVHDSLYSAPALNYWVYYWFIDELHALKQDPFFKNYDFEHVFPITLVEIDTLILYEKKFIQHELDLPFLIKEYHEFVRFGQERNLLPEMIEIHALQSALSFSEFVRDYSRKHRLEIDFTIIASMLKEFGIE